ncbi:MAG: phytanoyl-CoA dioxygenase family protein [Candidatus Poribacteria bacterium]|nr:phytanoyl-CoA dioxygenase family protein [Candidatus Poribacteria bacterium]
MDKETMTNEENYAFDVAGYLHIPSVLNHEEVSLLNKGLDVIGDSANLLGGTSSHRELFRDLLIHPTLVWYLNQIIGHGFRLDQAPRLLGQQKVEIGNKLLGGDEPRNPSLAYRQQNGRRSCQGVKAIWVLDDVADGDGGLVVVQASHKSNVETPDDLATGVDDMGLVIQPELKAGDLFLVAAPTLHGIQPWKGERKRLLTYWYAARAAIQSNPSGPYSETESLPSWKDEATPAQKAVMYRPGYKGSNPPPVLNTNGKQTWVEEDSSVIHPSIYIRDPNSGIDEKEFYFWDLNGYLVVRGVMDEQWLAEANEAVDKFQDRIVVGDELAGGSVSQAGTGRPLLSGLLDLPDPYNAPFRRMIAHPSVVQRLNWMGGSGYRTGGATVFCAVEGTSGHALHDGNEPMSPSRGYFYKNGRSYAETVTITWQLRDVQPGLGGFACVPGSHKTQYSMPRGIRTCDDTMGLVVQPVMNAGDVLFFMDGGCTHGALAWKNPIPRRGVLIKYQSKNTNWGGGVVDPQDRWGEMVEDMSEEQFAVMRGPERDGGRRTVPRLVVEDGQVYVSYNPEGDSYSSKYRKPGEKRR